MTKLLSPPFLSQTTCGLHFPFGIRDLGLDSVLQVRYKYRPIKYLNIIGTTSWRKFKVQESEMGSGRSLPAVICQERERELYLKSSVFVRSKHQNTHAHNASSPPPQRLFIDVLCCLVWREYCFQTRNKIEIIYHVVRGSTYVCTRTSQ